MTNWAFSTKIVLDATMAAAQAYAGIIVDHDPDDGDHVVPGAQIGLHTNCDGAPGALAPSCPPDPQEQAMC